MASSSSIPQFSGRGRRETLADFLAAGPLSLASALHCATAIAGELRDLHEAGRSFGQLTPNAVLLSDSGTTLELSRNHQSTAPLHTDVQAFGAILNELLVRSGASGGGRNEALPASVRSSPAGIRLAGARLAGKCLAAQRDSPAIQQALTEVRLLYVMARQNEADPAGGPAPASPMKAFPVMAPVAAPLLVAPVLIAPVPLSKPVVKPGRQSAAPADEQPNQPETAPVVALKASHFGKPKAHEAQLERASSKCPKCDSAEVYISRPRSNFESLLTRWKFALCRCHRCYHRYFVIGPMRIAKDMPVGTMGRSFKQVKKVHRRH